jgi:hypothetical protein
MKHSKAKELIKQAGLQILCSNGTFTAVIVKHPFGGEDITLHTNAGVVRTNQNIARAFAALKNT